MTASISSDIESFRSIKVVLGSYCYKSTRSKSEFDEKVDKISEWVADQKKSADKAAAKQRIENVGKILRTTVNAVEKFQSGDVFDIASGTLEMISGVAILAGGPYGMAVAAICSIIGDIVSANKPSKPSLVEQIAEVVHKQLMSFNNELLTQEFSGLKRRISDQIIQLQCVSREDKLVDGNLWNDYIQFVGKLSSRLESPLEFNFNDNLAKDDNVVNFVTVLKMYCHAHVCYMALLTIARVRFEEVGGRHKEIETIDRKMRNQTRDAKLNLEYLSDEKYLAFIGWLPSANGRLTKILSLKRNVKARRLVASLGRSLELPEMPDLPTVESAASKVARQSVKLKMPENLRLWYRNRLIYSSIFQLRPKIVFINETKFPMKIASGEVGNVKGNLEFVQVVKPHSHYKQSSFGYPLDTASTGGYLVIYNNGELPPVKEPCGENVGRVIEFALSDMPFSLSKVNIQDKTDGQWTKGLDTYNKMTSDKKKVVYWVEDKVHYMAVGEIIWCHVNILPVAPTQCWLFVVQDFDPSVDLVEE